MDFLAFAAADEATSLSDWDQICNAINGKIILHHIAYTGSSVDQDKVASRIDKALSEDANRVDFHS